MGPLTVCSLDRTLNKLSCKATLRKESMHEKRLPFNFYLALASFLDSGLVLRCSEEDFDLHQAVSSEGAGAHKIVQPGEALLAVQNECEARKCLIACDEILPQLDRNAFTKVLRNSAALFSENNQTEVPEANLRLDSQFFSYGLEGNGNVVLSEHFGIHDRAISQFLVKWSPAGGRTFAQDIPSIWDRRTDFGGELIK